MPGQDGALQVWNHGFVVAENAGEYFFFDPQLTNEVFAQLGFHGAGPVARRFELAEGDNVGVVVHEVA